MSLRAPWYATSGILSLDGRPLSLACGLCVYCRPLGSNARKTQEPLLSSAIVGAVAIVARLIFSVPLCLLT